MREDSNISYVAIGLCFGIIFGSAYDNLAIGICIGLAIGVLIDNSKKKNKPENDMLPL